MRARKSIPPFMSRFVPVVFALFIFGSFSDSTAATLQDPAVLSAALPLYARPHALTLPQAVDLTRQAFLKVGFFKVPDYQENNPDDPSVSEPENRKAGLSKIHVEGFYGRLSVKNPGRFGNTEQSRLYRVTVWLQPDEQGIRFAVTAKNEGVLGRGYVAALKARLEEELNRRLAAFDALKAADPVSVAKKYLTGESLAEHYGFSTLELLKLDYEPPGSPANYLNALQFLSAACPDRVECLALQDDILSRDTFWTALSEPLKHDPLLLVELGRWLKPGHPKYAYYAALLNESASGSVAASSERVPVLSSEALRIESLRDDIFESDRLPEGWRAKGVGSEKGRAIETRLAFKGYEHFRRSCALDVDTEEVLRVRRVSEKLLPYALRKGLDYKIHIYDDTTDWKDKDDNNAFTSGGGILYVSRSLIQELDPQDDAALAAVLAHELGHNEAYHIQRRVMRSNVASVIYQISGIGDLFIPGVSGATQLTGLIILRGFSRADELEADRLGLYVLSKAGYEPEAMSRVLKILSRIDKNRFTGLLDTHPAPPARLKRVEYLLKHREILARTTPGNAGEMFPTRGNALSTGGRYGK